MRSPTSFAGTQVTPFERYRAQASGPDQMNQKEFWQSGQAPQYSTTNMIRSALGMDPAAHPLVADALRRRRMQAGQGRGGPGLGGPAMGRSPNPWHEPVDRSGMGAIGSGMGAIGGGMGAIGGGMGGYGSGTFAPAPRPMGPPVTLSGGVRPSILGAPVGTYQVPMPDWAATPPSIQPMPPVALGQNDPRLTVLR